MMPMTVDFPAPLGPIKEITFLFGMEKLTEFTTERLAILTQTNNIQMKLTVRELVTFGRFPYSGGRTTAEDQEIIDRAIFYMELPSYRFVKSFTCMVKSSCW